MKLPKKFKIKLESKENVEALLQEIYDECCKNIEAAQRNVNKLESSTNLNEEILDGKAKYAKAINDFIATIDKAVRLKHEVAKSLIDVMKNNGDVAKSFSEGEVPSDWQSQMANLETTNETNDNSPIKYTLS